MDKLEGLITCKDSALGIEEVDLHRYGSHNGEEVKPH